MEVPCSSLYSCDVHEQHTCCKGDIGWSKGDKEVHENCCIGRFSFRKMRVDIVRGSSSSVSMRKRFRSVLPSPLCTSENRIRSYSSAATAWSDAKDGANIAEKHGESVVTTFHMNNVLFHKRRMMLASIARKGQPAYSSEHHATCNPWFLNESLSEYHIRKHRCCLDSTHLVSEERSCQLLEKPVSCQTWHLLTNLTDRSWHLSFWIQELIYLLFVVAVGCGERAHNLGWSWRPK